MKRKLLAFVTILALFAPFTLAHAAPQVLYLAYQGPLTGPEAVIGVDQVDAVSWAIKVFNASQSNYEVRLLKVDDQGDPAIGGPVSAAVAAKSEVLGLVGPAYSVTALASFPAYKSTSLPMISPSATRNTLTDPNSSTYGGPVFFRLATLDVKFAEVVAQYAIKGVASPRVYIVDDQSAYGTSAIASAKSFVQRSSGAQIVGSDSVAESTADLSGLIAKIKPLGTNVVVYYGYQSLGSKLVKALRAAGETVIFAGSDAIFISDFPAQTGAASEGIRVVGSLCITNLNILPRKGA